MWLETAETETGPRTLTGIRCNHHGRIPKNVSSQHPSQNPSQKPETRHGPKTRLHPAKGKHGAVPIGEITCGRRITRREIKHRITKAQPETETPAISIVSDLLLSISLFGYLRSEPCGVTLFQQMTMLSLNMKDLGYPFTLQLSFKFFLVLLIATDFH